MPFTPIDDDQTEAGQIVSIEVFQAICNNVNYLMDSMPVGTIICVLTGIPGIPVPDPDPAIWQLCEGQVVLDQNSPIRNQTLPTMNDGSFIKAAENIGVANEKDGANQVSLAHNHGGLTDFDDFIPHHLDSGSIWNGEFPHKHGIDMDLVATHDFTPPSIVIRHYIKIK